MTGSETSDDDLGPIGRVGPSNVPAELRRLERIAGRWIDDRADLFDPHGWERQDEYQTRLKAFSELSIYLMLGDQLPVEPSADRTDGHELVVERVHDRSYREAIRRNPAEIRVYGYPPIYVDLAGELRDPAVRDALGDVLGGDAAWARERQPYALLDVWHMATLCGIEPPYDRDTILRTSSLVGGVHPIRAELEDVYPLTHDIMFARGFGLEGFGFATDPLPYDVRCAHVGLALRYLAAELYDPLLEVLLTGVLQHQLPPDLVGVCLQRLVEVAESHGHVPDHSGDDPRLDTISDANTETLAHLGDRAVDWGSQYHVNLVAGFCALGVRAEWPALREAFEWRTCTYDPETLLGLGEALDHLAKYELESGARRLRDVAGTDAAAAYPQVFEAAVTFLREQRRADGSFGYWPEERLVLGRAGVDADQFDRQFLATTTEACADALDAIDDEVED
ncbi:DUF6895 family protein [Haloplanus pelagicus]|uniref:DUF6895 family protein n=1 Tax=Haloplanus pelagicus TaxID=2949995 RepID=UPI00203E6309|nr:hypothetical protein [Haloplanus sp. HW8-1]